MSIRMYVWKLTDREKDGLQLFYAKYGKNKSIEIVLAGEHEPDKEKEMIGYVKELHLRYLIKMGVII